MEFWNYLAIRLAQAFFVVFLVVTIVFFVSRTVTDPVATLLPTEGRRAADVEQLKETLGLNDPLLVQYGNSSGTWRKGTWAPRSGAGANRRSA